MEKDEHKEKKERVEGESESGVRVKGGVTLLERLQRGLKLYQKVDPDCSTWSLDDGQLVITLAKREPREWTALYE